MADLPKTTSDTTEVTLPSGLSGVIRRLKLKEMDLISSRKENKKGRVLEKLFESIWIETTDLGVYQQPFLEFKQDSEGNPIIDWSQVFEGDRNVLLIYARCHTRGDKFEFDTNCRRCGEKINWVVNLKDLSVFDLSDKVKKQLATTGENRFDVTLPYCENVVGYKVMQGYDQNNLAKMMQQRTEDQFTASLEPHLIYISGIRKPSERRKYISEMDVLDLEFLQNEFFENEPSMQTEIEIDCAACNSEQQVQLPLDNDFFLARRQSKRKT